MLDIAELFDFQPVYYSATVVFCPVFYALHSSVLEIQEIKRFASLLRGMV